MEHYQPMGDLNILLKPGEKMIKNDRVVSIWRSLQEEIYRVRGEVIAYGYDCEASLKDTIVSFFGDTECDGDRLDKYDIGSIILKNLDFAKKISVFEECAKKVGFESEELVKDLNFIRKRRNRFAHEEIVALPINQGLDGFNPIFSKNGTETIVNNQFVKEYIERCQKVVNKLAGIRVAAKS